MTTVHIAYGLTALMALGIAAIGVRFLLAPRTAAAGYGVRVELSEPGSDAYLTAKGVRDIASGLIAVALLLTGTPQSIAWFLIAATLIPVVDAINVFRHEGPMAIAFGIHGATAVFMLVVAGLLLIQ